MANDKAKFYITTPIYYVNARPHIGHTYTTIVCDAISRRKRMLGVDTHFLTGTDEHGQKIERSAANAGKQPKQLADEVSASFRELWDRMNISYDKFMRTTDPAHERGVQELFRTLRDKGYIYKGSYTGQYCVFDELYVTEGGPGTPCPECGRPTETVTEENYFFKLSAFEDKLLKFYNDNPDWIRPETRKNEVLSFVRGGLRDLSVSRGNIKWGIPVPDDPEQVMYVWLDALCTYMTGVGYGSPDKKDQERYARYWPADVHMIGKEIVRFHCVYWPAFLMAAGLPLPKSIMAHGWLLFEQDKMSKSRGNIVRAETILEVLGGDALRYFLFREIVFGQDGSFSFDALVQRFNSDLANGLGNLSSRTLSMITRYFKGEVPYPSTAATRTAADDAIQALAGETITSFNALWDDYQFSKALEAAWGLVSAVDKYIVENEPWSLADKQDDDSRSRLATVLYTTAEALRIVTALAHPVLPDSTAKIWAQLGLGDIAKFPLAGLKWGQLQVGTKLGKVEPVFPRADKSTVERMQTMEQERNAPVAQAEAASAGNEQKKVAPVAGAAEASTAKMPAGLGAEAGQPAAQSAVGPSDGAPAASGVPAPSTETIVIDDFAKIDLRVAQVKVAEKVKGADKLLRLEVDLGYETRQIVAGIALAYSPEQLVGRKIIIIANLQPRKLRGLESQGMLLAASLEGGAPVLAGFLEEVPVGAKLK
ncbi:MAG TPA: methionine--tRNA ligase [Terriglobales bacterium]|nr:methionine--tRNA ligase [Terriglobales bacterium]